MSKQDNLEHSGFVVVHATDLRPDNEATLEHGVAITKSTQGKLVTLHVTEEDSETALAKPQKLMEQWPYAKPEIPHHMVICRIGESPKKGVVNSIRDNDANLLIVGTRRQMEGDQSSRRSVAEVASLNAPVPTLVIHLGQQGLLNDEGDLQIRRVLLPVGDGEEARDAIEGVTQFLDDLEIDEVEIILLRVGDDEILEYVLTPERDGWRWLRESRQGFVPEAIGKVATDRDVDLICMSTRGQDGVIDVFSGTHTQKVIRRVPKPLLVIPMH